MTSLNWSYLSLKITLFKFEILFVIIFLSFLFFSFLPYLEKVVRIKKTFYKILWISQQGNVFCIYLYL